MDTIFAATLLAVMEEGSVVATARRMRLTPGAVALRIKALERDLKHVADRPRRPRDRAAPRRAAHCSGSGRDRGPYREAGSAIPAELPRQMLGDAAAVRF